MGAQAGCHAMISLASAALSQREVQFSWQAQHLRSSGTDFVAAANFYNIRYVSRSRRSAFATRGANFVAGAALRLLEVRFARQVQDFGNLRRRLRGRHSTFDAHGHKVMEGWIVLE